MGHARFEVVHGVRAVAGGDAGAWRRGAPSADAHTCAWRLLGPNNRELGRGAGVHPDRPSCVAAVERLVAGLRRSPATTAPALSRDLARGEWSWRLLDPTGAVLATSARGYARQRECRYALSGFVAAAGEAPLPAAEEAPAPGALLRPAFTQRASGVQPEGASAAPGAATLPSVPTRTDLHRTLR